MQTTYQIRHVHGQTEYHETYEEALAAIEDTYADPVIGHDGDIPDGGRSTLVWADETSAALDDGSRAVARIVELYSNDDPYED